jgi:single-strand DNA-binding protein
MLNNIQVIGYLGRDPEMRTFPSGDRVANFTVATTEKWKDKQTGEPKEATEWHRVVANGRLAEIVGEYLRKGSLVYVDGSIRTRKYIDKDGVERQIAEIRCDQMRMLGGTTSRGGRDDDGSAEDYRAPQGQSRAPAPAAQTRSKPAGGSTGFDDMDDDIPF